MKKPISLLLALLALGLVPLSAQEDEGDPPPPEQTPPPLKPMATITDMEKLFRAYGAMHGGRQNLNGLKTVAFRLVPHEVSEEGDEVEQPPLQVTVKVRGTERAVRIEEDIEKRHAVKIVDGLGAARTWLDGEEREIPELRRHASEEGTTLLRLLDLVFYPESPELKSKYDGYRKRDGVQYLTAEFEFHPSRFDPLTYLQFFHPETGMIERIDAHDRRTPGNLRVYTIYLREYAPVGEGNPHELLKFPGRVEFVSREGETLASWRFVDVVANPDLESSAFREP